MNPYKYNELYEAKYVYNEESNIQIDKIGELLTKFGKMIGLVVLIKFFLKYFVYDKLNKKIVIKLNKDNNTKKLREWLLSNINKIYDDNPELIRINENEFINTPKMKLLKSYITQTNAKRLLKDIKDIFINLTLKHFITSILPFKYLNYVLATPIFIYLSYLGINVGMAYNYIGFDVDGEYLTMGINLKKDTGIEMIQLVCYSKDKNGKYYAHALPDPPKELYSFNKDELDKIEKFYKEYSKENNTLKIDDQFINRLGEL